MEGDLIRINEWLSPLSWLYAIGVETRNALFDMGILPSRSYDIPIINIGNINRWFHRQKKQYRLLLQYFL